jgi:mannose-6-phosphate isomerase
MKLKAAYKDYLWGGTRLKAEFGKVTELSPLAEAWEVSCHPDGASRVVGGAFDGRTLWDVLSANPGMMGEKCHGKMRFPILIKWIDAKERLSLQVHPDDGYAMRVENQLGKNEMWYIADCKPGAEIVLGFEREVSKAELRDAIRYGTLEGLLRRVPVRPGDCYCIPAGMLHAIGGGILIAEVQQSSNVTYRVYDYGRRGVDGKLRELHVDKAVEVTDTSLKAVRSDFGVMAEPGYVMEPLSRWGYFDARRYTLHGALKMTAGADSFHTYVCLDGNPVISYGGGAYGLVKGESVFIPAGMGDYFLKGDATVLYTGM